MRGILLVQGRQRMYVFLTDKWVRVPLFVTEMVRDVVRAGVDAHYSAFTNGEGVGGKSRLCCECLRSS